MLAKLLAGELGIMAFFVCVAGGLIAGTRAEVAIGRALEAMLIFCLLGWVLGWAADTVIHEHMRKEAQDALSESEPLESQDVVPEVGQTTES